MCIIAVFSVLLTEFLYSWRFHMRINIFQFKSWSFTFVWVFQSWEIVHQLKLYRSAFNNFYVGL